MSKVIHSLGISLVEDLGLLLSELLRFQSCLGLGVGESARF